jgi:hypothetical protein
VGGIAGEGDQLAAVKRGQRLSKTLSAIRGNRTGP